MSDSVFRGGLRTCLGDPSNTVTLEISSDSNRIFLVIQENTDLGKMRSRAVQIERPSGDSRQLETYMLFEELIKHIHEMHEKNPLHPAYIVKK